MRRFEKNASGKVYDSIDFTDRGERLLQFTESGCIHRNRQCCQFAGQGRQPVGRTPHKNQIRSLTSEATRQRRTDSPCRTYNRKTRSCKTQREHLCKCDVRALYAGGKSFVLIP